MAGLDFLSPDVISQEVQGQSGQIPLTSTSGFALAGYSPRGPENKPLVFSSFQTFVAMFGSFSNESFNAYAAAAYFQNGGNILIFVRCLHSDAAFATGTLAGWTFQASGRGTWANGMVVSMAGDPNQFNAVSGTYAAFDVTVSVINPTTGLLTVDETYNGTDLVNVNDPEFLSNLLTNESNDVFSTGSGIPPALLPTQETDVVFASSVSGVNAYTGSVSGTGVPILPGSFFVSVSGVQVGEDNGNGGLVPTGASSVTGSVNYTTGAVNFYISPAPASTGQPITADYILMGAPSVSVTLSGGLNGSEVTANDVVGAQLLPLQQGIYALNLISDTQFQLGLPDYAGDPITDLQLITYAESREDIMVLLQPPSGVTPQTATNYKRQTVNTVSTYAAYYYPWVKIPDPLNNSYPLLMPPCGHVAGRYAYNDAVASVGKAPAGVNRGQLQWITGIERVLSKGDRDIVYQAQINPIRSDAEVGNAIWGNKTCALSSSDFDDVNIRRLFIYLRLTQTAGLLDMVFEDVGPTTWGIITARLDSFLEQLFINGVIGSGVTDKSQAYNVICNASNNPPAVQMAKMIIVDEYIKPNLAAEIILLRLQRVFDASQT